MSGSAASAAAAAANAGGAACQAVRFRATACWLRRRASALRATAPRARAAGSNSGARPPAAMAAATQPARRGHAPGRGRGTVPPGVRSSRPAGRASSRRRSAAPCAGGAGRRATVRVRRRSCRVRSRWRWAGPGAGSWRRRHAAPRRRPSSAFEQHRARPRRRPLVLVQRQPIAALGLARHVEPQAVAQHQLAGDSGDGGRPARHEFDLQFVQRHVPITGDDAAAVVGQLDGAGARANGPGAPPDVGAELRREDGRRQFAFALRARRRAGRHRAIPAWRDGSGNVPAANGSSLRARSAASSRRRGP